MTEFFNFHGGWYVAEQNAVWILLALALGVWVGWKGNSAGKAS